MAEIGVGIAVAAGGEAVKQVMTRGGGKIGYVVHFAQIIEDIKTEARKLADEKNEVHNLIVASQNNNEVTKTVVTNWLMKVDTVADDVQKLRDKAEKINQWYKGWLFSRFKLGKKAVEKIGVIQELLEERIRLEPVGYPTPFQNLEIVSAGDFEFFESREDTAKKVVDVLQNNQVSMIGLFGMPGIGKTMLMEAIKKQAKDEKLFHEVVLVIVSQNPDIRTIQKNIAEQLGLDLGGSPIDVAATKLSARLSHVKKVLVAFDDIWERLDMTKVGIPYKSNMQGCKVLFTTRSESVCDRMEVHEKIEVKVLSDTDAWKLFHQKAGDVVDSSSHQEVAHGVLNECKGLPLAIVTLGLALKNKEKAVWLDARTRLKKSTYKGMSSVFAIVKLSYDFLHDDKAAQMCFLFCSLFPEDFRIKTDVLLSYMLGEELLEKGDTMEEARNGLLTIIDKLRSSGILLQTKEGEIMMHDIIRDAAIYIASDPDEGEGFIVKSGLGLKEWPPIDREIEKCRRLSLMCNDLSFCPKRQINASLLLTLSLSQSQNLEEIPSDFFKEMKHLKTLDLSGTGIRSLPKSFQCLQCLHTLLMDACLNLSDISQVGELEMLEILSFSYSHDVQIPVSMQKLTGLKMLNASSVGSLFPPRVISSLHQLEELYLDDRGIEKELVFSEVASLTRLTWLTIRLPAECMLKDFPIHWKNLSKFSIKVGETEGLSWRDRFHELGTRRVCLELGSPYQNVAPSIQISNLVGVLAEKIEVLEVHYHNHFPTVADLNANGLYQNLIYLSVSYCARLRHLLSTTSIVTKTRKPLFSNLEELRLHDLVNFAAICDGPVPDRFLSKLKKFSVERCPSMPILIPVDLLGNLQKLEYLSLNEYQGLEKVVEFEGYISKQPPSLIFPCLRKLSIWHCYKLKCVLPSKSARDLLQLEYLEIHYCSNMEIVFEGDEDNGDKDKLTLPRLKTLDLISLPSLSSFGPPGLLFDFPALVDMGILGCGNLKSLPLCDKHSIPKLKELEANTGWLDKLECEDESLKVYLKSLPGLAEYYDPYK